MIFNKSTDSYKLIKISLIIKYLHIPTYIIFFAFGALTSLMIFMTIPLVVFIFFVDLLTLLLSSMISIYAIIKFLRENKINRTLSIVTLICQIWFCIDIITLFILNASVKKKF